MTGVANRFSSAPDLPEEVPHVTLARLNSAMEASWDERTASLGASRPGNPALGQCYPTTRVVQWFFPDFEIAVGEVDTGSSRECHFWNVDPAGDPPLHVDLSWQQFAPGSTVTTFKLLDRHALGDSPLTVERCRLLLRRVLAHLAGDRPPPQ
jgi:hypothetical protein